MTGMQIKDATGTQRGAQVDSDNKLSTRAVTASEIGYNSLYKTSAFILYMSHNIVTGDTDEIAGYFTNTGTGLVILKKMMVAANGEAAIEAFLATPDLAGGNARVPLNLNRGSATGSNITAREWAATPITGTVVGANEIVDIRISTTGGTHTHEFDDALILTPTTNLAFVTKGVDNTVKVRITLTYYEREIGLLER